MIRVIAPNWCAAVSRSRTGSEAALTRLAAPPRGKHVGFACDVSDPRAVAALMKEATDMAGSPVSVLVNAAGASLSPSFLLASFLLAFFLSLSSSVSLLHIVSLNTKRAWLPGVNTDKLLLRSTDE